MKSLVNYILEAKGPSVKDKQAILDWCNEFSGKYELTKNGKVTANKDEYFSIVIDNSYKNIPDFIYFEGPLETFSIDDRLNDLSPEQMPTGVTTFMSKCENIKKAEVSATNIAFYNLKNVNKLKLILTQDHWKKRDSGCINLNGDYSEKDFKNIEVENDMKKRVEIQLRGQKGSFPYDVRSAIMKCKKDEKRLADYIYNDLLENMKWAKNTEVTIGVYTNRPYMRIVANKGKVEIF